jgi:hypothetical protein
VHDFAGRLGGLLGVPLRETPCSWAYTEAAIGMPVPEDYRELIDRTGPVIVDEWLCLFGPSGDNRDADLAVLVAERERAWVRFREAGIELRETYFAEGARLLAFAAVESNYFFWHARPGVPSEAWPVVIVDADLEIWYEFDMSATECVYRILLGELQLDPFEDLFGGSEHRVEPFPALT